MPTAITDVQEPEDMPSSSVSAPEPVAQQQEPAQKDDTVASSAATGENEADTLSVVRDVVDKSRPADAASPAEGEDGSAGASATHKELDNEDYTDVPFNKHPRFQQLLQRTKQAEIGAQRYNNVNNFLQENGLTDEEAADTLQIVALARVNPQEAWTRVRPWVQNLLIAAGEVLPDDLAQRVQAGQITQEDALALSRSQAAVSAGQRARLFEQHQSQTRQQREIGDGINHAVSTWEADRYAKDPNFAAKQPLLQKEIVWMFSKEGRPANPQAAMDQLQRAYKAVNASFKAPVAATQQPRGEAGRFAPATRPAIRPVVGGQASASVPKANETTLDIIQRFAGARGR